MRHEARRAQQRVDELFLLVSAGWCLNVPQCNSKTWPLHVELACSRSNDMRADLIGDFNFPVSARVSLHVSPVMNWPLVRVHSAESLKAQTGSSPCGRTQDLPHTEMSLHLHLPVYFFVVASGTKSGPCIRQRSKNKGHDSNPYTNNMMLHV